jgi:hypothetical protein
MDLIACTVPKLCVKTHVNSSSIQKFWSFPQFLAEVHCRETHCVFSHPCHLPSRGAPPLTILAFWVSTLTRTGWRDDPRWWSHLERLYSSNRSRSGSSSYSKDVGYTPVWFMVLVLLNSILWASSHTPYLFDAYGGQRVCSWSEEMLSAKSLY